MKKTLIGLLFIAFLPGCVSMGREVKSDQLSGFTKGKTTIEDVAKALGKPTSSTITADGRRFTSYTFVHAQARPASFIPVVGLLAGGSDVRSSMVFFTFDKNGVMQDFTQSESATGTGIGFAGGEYRAPDTTLPREQPK